MTEACRGSQRPRPSQEIFGSMLIRIFLTAFGFPESGRHATETTRGNNGGKLNKRDLDWGPGGEGTCAPGTPCANGACCNSSGICGYSPDHCGPATCISNCDAKASCGRYAPAGKEKYPLNVCCSRHGFCGTTAEFCGTGCDRCHRRSSGRNIGYYESWANTRQCDRVRPQDLDLFGLTHLNFAFAFFHPTTFEVTAMDKNAESLTRHAFSDMASTSANKAKFIESIIHFMNTYGFQGVDIDWEYPGATARGGRPEDKANFVVLCREMQAAFAGKFGLAVTLPASFWYLQHFDVKAMVPYVPWFNVMTYDVHGVGDRDNRYTGPYIRPHINLTESDDALGLLWRAGVNAANVVMGLGYYGRSFTLADPTCTGPGCLFQEGGAKGDCTDSMGILSAADIDRIIKANAGKRDVHGRAAVGVIHDEAAAVKIATFGGNQWVSCDDEDTFSAKKQFGMRLGLGGYMAWAIDQGVFGIRRLRALLCRIHRRRHMLRHLLRRYLRA
ncbi:Chitotriosidase-1 [Achaetomium macrosporum]|uniref:chitinase n=1 Tax=Achaetomium macrosporum TaxID=79813 RepID=A0AAN7H6Q5_9PEZI|nr:Chitotriosidase-1 [Achaetomium macrosporum]